MPEGDDLVRLTTEPASTALAGRVLGAEAQARLAESPGASVRAVLAALVAESLVAASEHVLAHTLPKREAVWWASRCVREVVGASGGAEVEAALHAAEAWTAAPGDSNRRRAWPAAEAAGLKHPAGCVALAAYLSGGSLAPPSLPAVPPAEHLTGDCVVSALKLAAVLGDPARAEERHRAFVAIGLNVARGKDRWKDQL